MHEESTEFVLYELPSGVFTVMEATLWAYINRTHNNPHGYKFVAQGEHDVLITLAKIHNLPLLAKE